MSANSEKVKRWRKNVKINAVNALGGGCAICGYDKCNRSLDFHHIIPEEKDFGFGKIIARPKKISLIIEELKKCILVCSNCHGEIHDGMSKIPNILPTFDESWFDKKSKMYDACPVCGKNKGIRNVTCSRSCSATLSYKVDWNSVDLKSLLQDGMSYSKIGDVLGCSGAAVAKRVKKLKIEKYYCNKIGL